MTGWYFRRSPMQMASRRRYPPSLVAIALSTLMLSAGPLDDRHGHKQVWLDSMLLLVAGSLACALAKGITPLLATR